MWQTEEGGRRGGCVCAKRVCQIKMSPPTYWLKRMIKIRAEHVYI